MNFLQKIKNLIVDLGRFSSSSSLIIDAFYKDLVSKEDQKLFDLAFAKKVDQAQLDEFLRAWDIEKYGERKSMMLSYLMKTNPQLQFSNYEKPRLEGLLRYHRFRNLNLISHYAKVVKALNENNIFPMILKGGAMKHIRPDLSRAMGDIDILVATKSEFLAACEISKKLGYVFEEFIGDHSVDLHLPNSKEGTIDIHQYVNLETDYDKTFLQDLFARAKKEKTFGVEAFVPCFEDIVFLGMINLSRNLHHKTSMGGILYFLFDFKYLTENKADFDWDLVLQNIVKTKTHTQALLAMKFINKIAPTMLLESPLKSRIINKEFDQYCDRVMFNHFYFLDLKYQCKKLKIKDAVRDCELMKKYLAKKPKYFLLKRVVRKSYILTRIFLILNNKQLTQS